MRLDIPPPFHKPRDRRASSCSLHSTRRGGMLTICRSMMRVRFWQCDLHFRHGDHRQEPDEKQKQRSENPERADEGPDVDPGWNKNTPCRWNEIAMQSADDDDESL